MTDWKCTSCGYMLQADIPPKVCSNCKQKCEFVNVSCYIPDCGQTGADTRL
jgi:rubredoxin